MPRDVREPVDVQATDDGVWAKKDLWELRIRRW